MSEIGVGGWIDTRDQRIAELEAEIKQMANEYEQKCDEKETLDVALTIASERIAELEVYKDQSDKVVRLEMEVTDLKARLDRWNHGGNYVATNARIKEFKAIIDSSEQLIAEMADKYGLEGELEERESE